MKRILLLLLVSISSYQTAYCQIFASGLRKKIKREEEEGVKKFPEPLLKIFESNSLGFHLQQNYKDQANISCKIIRGANDNRLFIPNDLVNAYKLDSLYSKKVILLPFSSNLALFTALKPSDTTKINNNKITDANVRATRVIGLDDPYILFGDAMPSPIIGFPSVYFQKSCASYYEGNIDAGLKLPIGEMKSSLSAEAESKSLITSITGRFLSPMKDIIGEQSARSVYLHMLVWEKYVDDFQSQPNSTELLINTGQYIEEMQATLINYSTDKSVNSAMKGEIAVGIKGGAFDVNGKLVANRESSSRFSLKNFTTLIHKNVKPVYFPRRLPNASDIGLKLASSISLSPTSQPSFQGYASSLIPIQFTKILGGIPAHLCAWEIETSGYNNSIWRAKPEVSTTQEVVGGTPQCTCTITGELLQSAISNAKERTKGKIDLIVTLTSTKKAGSEKLSIVLNEPAVPITIGPEFIQVTIGPPNDIVVGGQNGNIHQEFEIVAFLDDSRTPVLDTHLSSPILEFISESQRGNLQIIGTPTMVGRLVTFRVTTNNFPVNYTKVPGGEISIPFKFRATFKLKTPSGTPPADADIVSETINLKVNTYQAPN